MTKGGALEEEHRVEVAELIEPPEGVEDAWSHAKRVRLAASSPVRALDSGHQPFSFQQTK